MADGGAQMGNPNDTNPPADEGQSAGGDNLFAELDEATRDWVKTRHGDDVGKLAKQAFEADKFAGSAVQVPGDDAAAEDWEKFYARVGRPENADAYAFKPPETLPETVPYDDELASSFKETAHSVGLRQDQATKLHDWFVDKFAGFAGDFEGNAAEDLSTRIESANTALKNEWGDPTGDTYRANLELAGMFWDAIDEKGNLQEQLGKAGLIGPDRTILVPEVAFAFAKAGAALFTDGGTLNGQGDGLQGANPFEGDGNLTQIMALIKQDPNKARTLAKAGGKDPKEYGL